MTSSVPPTPASPKVVKIKPAERGVPIYGCEHLERMLTARGNRAIENYKTCLRVVLTATPVIPQTSKTTENQPLTTLTPNYLCLQCNETVSPRDLLKHGNTTPGHRLYVESRSGALYCQMCDDFVWDPTLEELRMRKYGSGTFSTKSKKRKHDELFTDVKEDPRFLSTNTSEAPCQSTGIRGIYNMGATCYMNVILQSFVHNPLLRNFYLGEGHQKEDCAYGHHCMSCAMDSMFQDFYATDEAKGFDTRGFQAAGILGSFYLSKRKAYEELASNQEQDAHEFFQFLTEELHEINGGGRSSAADEFPTPKKLKSGNDPGCKCIIHQTFYGKLQSTITCQKCGDVNTSVESFLDLSLGLDALSKKKNLQPTASLSLEQCLDEEYVRAERCEYSCHQCDTSEAKKQLSIKSLPNVLCIQLKRFKQNNSNSASKITTKVDFPLKLEMLPYTNRARSQDTQQNSFELNRSCTYDLQSVVVHVGQLDTGHYVSYHRVQNQWFRFNDHNVTLATKSQVLNEQAFLLFYVIRSLA